MSKAVFLESVAGVAGDMLVASFLDAGVVTASELQALPGLLGLDGVQIVVSRVWRASLAATHVRVVCEPKAARFEHRHDELPAAGARHRHGPEPAAPPGPGHHHQPETEGEGEIHLELPAGAEGGHTHYADIDALLARSAVDEPVRQLARKIFRLLAEAEAAVHGFPIERVAFHEVGAVDSILDVVMAAYCVGKLGPCALYASPIRPGRGSARMAHGTYPVPPPASLRLLANLPVAPTPAAITRPDVELSTPTGIAILRALEPRFVAELPAGTILGQGLGAGTMDLGGFPNVFRTILFDEAIPVPGAERFDRDRVIEIACTVDDDTAEHLAWLAAQLLERGALDAWLAPVTGKKGRPAVCLSALAAEKDWSALAGWILEQGTTFGVRYRSWDRLKLFRRFERRETARGPLTYKVGTTKDGTVLKEKPEFEELRRFWENPADPSG